MGRCRHRVIARHNDRLFSTPMNLSTLSSLFGRPPRGLLVEDNALVRDVMAPSPDDGGYTVLRAESGPMDLVRPSSGDRVYIIVSDPTMPAMDGLTLIHMGPIQMAQERRPGLPAVLLIGNAGDAAALAVAEDLSGGISVMRRPVPGAQPSDRANALLGPGNLAAGASRRGGTRFATCVHAIPVSVAPMDRTVSLTQGPAVEPNRFRSLRTGTQPGEYAFAWRDFRQVALVKRATCP